VLEAALARPLQPQPEPQAQRVAGAGPRDVDAGVDGARLGDIALATKLDRLRAHRHLEGRRLAERERQSGEINEAGLIGHEGLPAATTMDRHRG
jgi:hypothetical protein